MDATKKKAKANEISEDEQSNIEQDIQKLTDDFIAKAEKMVDAKVKEIMTV